MPSLVSLICEVSQRRAFCPIANLFLNRQLDCIELGVVISWQSSNQSCQSCARTASGGGRRCGERKMYQAFPNHWCPRDTERELGLCECFTRRAFPPRLPPRFRFGRSGCRPIRLPRSDNHTIRLCCRERGRAQRGNSGGVARFR